MKVLGQRGGSFTRGPILFTHEDEYILLCHGTSILVLDGRTCLQVGKLDSSANDQGQVVSGHTEPIISLALHPTEKGKVFSASNDGHIFLWSYEAGKCLDGWVAPLRVASIVSAKGRNFLYVACQSETKTTTKGKGAPVMAMDLEMIHGDQHFKVLFNTGLGTALVSVSANGKILSVAQRNAISVWDMERDPNRMNVQTITIGYNAIRLAMHPSEQTVFWTNGTGSIFCKSLGSNGGAPTSKMHWHAHATLTISIAPDGKYLLSGGEEGVVVVWHLESNSRQFLSHLGSNVLRVTTNNSGSYYAVLLRSNSLLLISPGSLQIMARYDGIYVHGQNKSLRAGLMRDPRNQSALLMNNIPGLLQSYDPISGRVGANMMDVCEQNIIGKGNNKSFTLADVYCMATSRDGKWIVTYDRRMCDERRMQYDLLRFWKMDKNGKYIAYSAFEEPHDEPVKTIVFNPRHFDSNFYQCVTLGDDNKVRIWTGASKPTLAPYGAGKVMDKICWTCSCSLEFREYHCDAAAYSMDGSVLAISFGSIIRLYDSMSFLYLKTLTCNAPARELLFVKDYLIAVTGQELYCFDLESLSISWNLVIASVKNIKLHPDGEHFMAILECVNSSFILVLSTNSPIPVQCYKHGQLIKCADFVQSKEIDNDVPIIAFIDSSDAFNLVSVFNDDIVLPDSIESSRYEQRKKMIAPHLASALVRPSKLLAVEAKNISQVTRQYPAVNREKLILSNVPGHLLPSTIEAFDHFIKYKFAISPSLSLST